MKEPKIMITGANGQIGTVLTRELREMFGTNNIIATDISEHIDKEGPFEFLDILNETRLDEFVGDHGITQIYHLAAILSASGELNPIKTWNVNLNGLLSVFDVANKHKVDKVFFPSTIAVFGSTTPKVMSPQSSPLVPETVYGMSKVAGELWANYYNKKSQLDVRSVRYPGIIGYQSIPSGGTTDYAVEIFHAALKGEVYNCFLDKDTRLPMMYMDDAIRATIEIMQCEADQIKVRYSYNLAGMSFTPEEIYNEILQRIPSFKIAYNPDFRQQIAASWNESIDDSSARKDWGWEPGYTLASMVDDMIENLSNPK